MTNTRQFWTLLKLQPAISPVILFMPLAFATPLLMPLLMPPSSSYHPSFSILLSSQNAFLILLFGVLWLAPELLGTANARWTIGTEFFVTRAIDRATLYRARIAALYIAVAIIPLVLILSAISDSNLVIRENLPANQKEIFAHIPGSVGVPEKDSEKFATISIPNGAYLTGGFKLWTYLLWAAGAQLLISLISSLKHRKIILWTIWGVVIFAPLLLSIVHSRSITRGLKTEKSIENLATLSWTESLFLQFVSYQPFIWIATAIAIVTIHLWCERRFARAEY